MRNVLIFAAALSLAACNDGDRPTSPLVASSGAARSTEVAPTRPAAQGKPADQVGFTKVTEATSGIILISPGATEEIKVPCPAGTTLVSGGYHFSGFNTQAPPPWIWSNQRYYENLETWDVKVSNTLSGASIFGIVVNAYCAS